MPHSTKIRLANRSTGAVAGLLASICDTHYSLSAQAAHECLRQVHETLLRVINPEVLVTYDMSYTPNSGWREVVTVREPTHQHPYLVLLHETMQLDAVQPRDPHKRFGRVYNQLAHYLGSSDYCHPSYVETVQRLFPDLLVNLQQTHQYYVDHLATNHVGLSFRAKAYDGTSVLSFLTRSHEDVVNAENEAMQQAMTMGYRITPSQHVTH